MIDDYKASRQSAIINPKSPFLLAGILPAARRRGQACAIGVQRHSAFGP
jgi:hypothetical protein